MVTNKAEEMATRLEEWHDRWDFRLSTWLAKDDEIEYESVLEQVSNLVLLTIGLLHESLLNSDCLEELYAASEYLLNPDDFLSEDEHGVLGLLEDVAILITPLKKITKQHEALVYRYWKGEDDPVRIIMTIDAKAASILEYVKEKRGEVGKS